MLRIQLFGSFQVRIDDKPLTRLQTDRLQALLAYLVLHRDQPLSRQQLAVTFWPDTTDVQARTNLRTLLARLRETLPDADQFLMVMCFTLPTSITLSVGRKPCWIIQLRVVCSTLC
jgi:DNA-binding SARP family transcriptional activator